MKQSEEVLIENKDKLSVSELRTLNRYYLHPKGQRMCGECKEIFTEVRENFHIKKYQENGEISFNVKCKCCKNKDCAKIRSDLKKYPELYIKNIIPKIRHRAKECNCPFDVDYEYLLNLFIKEQNQLCYYTHEPLSFDYESRNNTHPHRNMASLDRKIPKDGYVKGNVAWTTYVINRQKSDLTEDEFYSLSEQVISVKESRLPIPA